MIKFKSIFLLMVLLIMAETINAQPLLPALKQAPQSAPIGGLGIMIAAGGAYAIKKLRQKK